MLRFDTVLVAKGKYGEWSTCFEDVASGPWRCWRLYYRGWDCFHAEPKGSFFSILDAADAADQMERNLETSGLVVIDPACI